MLFSVRLCRRLGVVGFVALMGTGLFSAFFQGFAFAGDAKTSIVIEGKKGLLGNGKHIVFVTGDEEYRSEESMSQMAKILAVHHGFKCTVLFAINPKTGEIDPGTIDNIPGLEALKTADLAVFFIRWRELPDEQMKYIDEYTQSGKPIIGVRTATHPFNYRKNKKSPYEKYSWKSGPTKGGWGRDVLGETWVKHYGHHKHESTRGVIVPKMKDHPIVKGCEDIWGPTDVYGLTTLHGDCKPLIHGVVLKGMKPTDEARPDREKVPVAWIKKYPTSSGKLARVFATTMGGGNDFKSEGLRRLFVNACYWGLEMEDKIPARSKVDLIGCYDPPVMKMLGHRKGKKPADYDLKE